MPTNLLNTEDGIKNGFFEFDFGYRDMSELNSDFQMGVQVYDLVTTKHQMSHEVKYHIKKTPKKNKSTMKSPTVRSPGGPNAVMSTSFRLVGTVNINLKNYDKTAFSMFATILAFGICVGLFSKAVAYHFGAFPKMWQKSHLSFPSI